MNELVLILFYASPETILVLRALSTVETSYLSKSSIRLNEAVGQAFVGGTRSPPGTNEAITIARTIANEMDGARFDPILVKAVAKSVKSCVELLLGRVDSLVCTVPPCCCIVLLNFHVTQIVRDRSAFTLLGPSATTQQMSNAQVASFVWHTRDRLARLKADHAEGTFAILTPALEVSAFSSCFRAWG
jgi:conserved oligomeric Golgi complex subunit 5